MLDDEQQRQVLTMPPSAFDDDRGNWATVRMYLYQLRHDSARMAVYADSARLALEEQLRAIRPTRCGTRSSGSSWRTWAGRTTRCGKAGGLWS